MKTTSSSSSVTRGMAIAPPANHVRSARRLPQQTKPYSNCTDNTTIQRKQVERLFPEFFTPCSDKTFAESHKNIFSPNSSLDHQFDEPLIQSWLQLYGGDGPQHL